MKKEQSERWVFLPFSFGCSSRSSVDVGSPSPLNDTTQTTQTSRPVRQKDLTISKEAKNTLRFKHQKSKLSHGIRRLIRRLKFVSQIFGKLTCFAHVGASVRPILTPLQIPLRWSHLMKLAHLELLSDNNFHDFGGKNEAYKDEMNEEEEKEMEIGYPTDVKHLTHIGWDGSTTISNSAKGWENLTTSEIISFPSISLKQFEIAMAKQAEAAAAAAVGDKLVRNT